MFQQRNGVIVLSRRLRRSLVLLSEELVSKGTLVPFFIAIQLCWSVGSLASLGCVCRKMCKMFVVGSKDFVDFKSRTQFYKTFCMEVVSHGSLALYISIEMSLARFSIIYYLQRTYLITKVEIGFTTSISFFLDKYNSLPLVRKQTRRHFTRYFT